MGRAAVSVRTAGEGDIPALVTLWLELRDEGLRRPSAAVETPEAAAARFAVMLADETSRTVVAEYEGEIVGMAQLARTRPTLLADPSSVELLGMHVASAHRRRGAGKALVAAAVAYADECDAENVVVSVFPQHREANRFYARLGFAPVVTRRIASVTSLRRRLGSPEGRAALLRRELHVPRRVAAVRRNTRRLVAQKPVD